jgi:hypothetical protein
MTATFAQRRLQTRAEARIEEQCAIYEAGELIDGFSQMDRIGDLKFQRDARRLLRTLTTDEQRKALYALVEGWLADERNEELNVAEQRTHNVAHLEMFRSNTPLFCEGAFLPDDDGAAA